MCLFLISYRTLIAFFSDGKAITIYINRYGEQYLDIAALIVIWVICLMGVYFLYKTLLEEKTVKDNQNNIIQKPQIENITLVALNPNANYNENTTILFPKVSDNLENNLNEEL